MLAENAGPCLLTLWRNGRGPRVRRFYTAHRGDYKKSPFIFMGIPGNKQNIPGYGFRNIYLAGILLHNSFSISVIE
ncbi:hypothetical protein EBL_c23420 [Shimwellia blattae DSM 4481 = NBRC 105725]|uniref:Uncharacterized protein n=1 Tax=Shimwellia blattae (strain ATCC 29907 / DSM 4481 / JCM 1650 / NBRC 105725 / CDC 9005-74) TaxID=630626 RepID=I2BA77_SHIBC|nr:hypothetical protein EBL_c23420 [Shimwellia blattae DSM 4481 = NBRC 105725]